MTETKFRELSVDEWLEMSLAVQKIIEPFARAKLEVMQLTLPNMVATREDGHYKITTSYPPEVQQHFERCDRMCEQAVAMYLRQEGYTLPEQEQ